MHINGYHTDLKDLLDWWKDHEDEFSCLSRAAGNVLCVPSTSETSKRNFNVAEQCNNQEHQTNLSSESVESILFLHNNMQ
jgi:hypothetical protein